MKTMEGTIHTIREAVEKGIRDEEEKQNREAGSSASKGMEGGGQEKEPSAQ